MGWDKEELREALTDELDVEAGEWQADGSVGSWPEAERPTEAEEEETGLVHSFAAWLDGIVGHPRTMGAMYALTSLLFGVGRGNRWMLTAFFSFISTARWAAHQTAKFLETTAATAASVVFLFPAACSVTGIFLLFSLLAAIALGVFFPAADDAVLWADQQMWLGVRSERWAAWARAFGRGVCGVAAGLRKVCTK